jgi:hypothetical protein
MAANSVARAAAAYAENIIHDVGRSTATTGMRRAVRRDSRSTYSTSRQVDYWKSRRRRRAAARFLAEMNALTP